MSSADRDRDKDRGGPRIEETRTRSVDTTAGLLHAPLSLPRHSALLSPIQQKTGSVSLPVSPVSSAAVSSVSPPVIVGVDRSSTTTTSTTTTYSPSVHSIYPGSHPPLLYSVSTPCSPCSSSRSSSISLSSSSSSRSLVFNNQDLFFSVLHYVEFVQLFNISRVCHSWNDRLAPLPSPNTQSIIPFSIKSPQSASLSKPPTPPVNHRSTSTTTSITTSLFDALLSRLVCSEPSSPPDQQPNRVTHSNKKKKHRVTHTFDASLLSLSSSSASVSPLLSGRRLLTKPVDYLHCRSHAHLSALPTNRLQQQSLLTRVKQMKHLSFSGTAERRLNEQFISVLVKTLSDSQQSQLLSLSLCGCVREGVDVSFSSIPQLLCPSFISASSISHHKNRPVTLTDAAFALLFCPSTSRTCLSKLHSLSLANCSELSDPSFLLLSTLPSLTNLNLSNCSDLSDDTIEYIVRHNCNLTSLDVSACRSLTNATPYYISSFLSASLTSLNLSNDGLINDAGVAHLTTVTKLTSLYLHALEFLTDKGITGLASCSLLTILDVSACPFLTNKGMSYLSLYLKLEWINLANCTAITDRGVHYITSVRHESTQRIQAPQQLTDAVNSLSLDEDDQDWIIASKQQSRAGSPTQTQRTLVSHLSLLSPAMSALNSNSLSPLLHLSLSFCNQVTDQGIRQIAAYAPLLQSLDLTGCTLLTDGSAAILTALSASLLHLSLSGCLLLSNISLVPLSSMRLKTLRLNQCQLINDEGVALLCSRHGGNTLRLTLTMLSLEELPRITDASVHILSTSFSLLRSLSIARCPQVTDQSCFHLSIFLPQLTELCLQGIDALTDEGWIRVMKMKQMNKVDVSLCTRLTCSAFVRLVPKIKSMTEQHKDKKKHKHRLQQQTRRAAMNDSCITAADDLSVYGSGSSSPVSVHCDEWSSSLQLLVLKGCPKITEEAVQQAREDCKRVKIVQ